MGERDLLVSALVGEILGPRTGTTEILGPDEDPVDEFITGVLAPHQVASIDPDADLDLLGEDEAAADDQADPGLPSAASTPLTPLAPALDPRARPASMGLSLSVEAAGAPVLDICATWARYGRSEGGGWHRRPLGEVWRGVDCSRQVTLSPSSDPGVRLHVRASARDRRWRVSIFLVNVTDSRGHRPPTEDHLFQPQVRVRCGEDLRLVPLEEARTVADEEQRSLSFLYRDHRPLARGHLCGATWRDIDPEQAVGRMSMPGVPPFSWPDGAVLFSEEVRAAFSPADVRTEYVPVVAVNSPEKAWATGKAPQLDPEVLSETWEPEALRAALEPLVVGYGEWIAVQERAASTLPESERQQAVDGLTRTRTVLSRIRAGIELLVGDHDARLAFCFANRAIAIQARWTKDRVNPWWPFQLAFQLINLPGLVDRRHHDRAICDLLWFPTGGGKTEAYLGLAAFIIAHRRLRAGRAGASLGGEGTAVLSRYTLRLLTIQQFRRALALVAACELLRVTRSRGLLGWRPEACGDERDSLWGGARFSAGLWVGGGVTPNNLQDFRYKDRFGRVITVPGALSILEGRGPGEGEPAQVLTCPACGATLAVPPDGYQPHEAGTLHLVLGDARLDVPPTPAELSSEPFDIRSVRCTPHQDRRFCTLSIEFTVGAAAGPEAVDAWVGGHIRPAMGPDTWLVAARGSRPGYFIRSVDWGRRLTERPIEFEVYCPNPGCHLNIGVEWSETTPTGVWPVIEAFRTPSGGSSRCPIPAWTVDEQVYHRCPSMVVSTVDKFARLAFEPRAAALFGTIERFHEQLGYYRAWCPPTGPASLPTAPRASVNFGRDVTVPSFAPPDLILQDELHLIEGPLGSMVGIYEAAVDLLTSATTDGTWTSAKYIASTATVRNAQDQVRSLFLRTLQVFPTPGLSADDSLFARTRQVHPLQDEQPGRLYVGVCAPGRGGQTPIVRIWSRLLQHVEDRRQQGAPEVELDSFWTLVGYFNPIPPMT